MCRVTLYYSISAWIWLKADGNVLSAVVQYCNHVLCHRHGSWLGPCYSWGTWRTTHLSWGSSEHHSCSFSGFVLLFCIYIFWSVWGQFLDKVWYIYHSVMCWTCTNDWCGTVYCSWCYTEQTKRSCLWCVYWHVWYDCCMLLYLFSVLLFRLHAWRSRCNIQLHFLIVYTPHISINVYFYMCKDPDTTYKYIRSIFHIIFFIYNSMT